MTIIIIIELYILAFYSTIIPSSPSATRNSVSIFQSRDPSPNSRPKYVPLSQYVLSTVLPSTYVLHIAFIQEATHAVES